MRYAPALAVAALILAAPAAHAAEVPAAVGLFTHQGTIVTALIDDSQVEALDRAELTSPDNALELPLTMEYAKAHLLADDALIEVTLRDIVGPGTLDHDIPETMKPGETTDVAIRADIPGTYTGVLRVTTTLANGDYLHSDLPFSFTFGAADAERPADAESPWEAWVEKGPKSMAKDINDLSREIAKLDREAAKLQKYAPSTTTTAPQPKPAAPASTGTASATLARQSAVQTPQQAVAPVAGEPVAVAAPAAPAAPAAAPVVAAPAVAPALVAPAPVTPAPAVAPAPAAPAPATEAVPTTEPDLIPADDGGAVIETQAPQSASATPETATVQTASVQNDRLLEGSILGAGAAALLVGLLKFAMTLGELRESRRRQATY